MIAPLSAPMAPLAKGPGLAQDLARGLGAETAQSWNEWHLVLLSSWGRLASGVAVAVALLTLFLAWRALRRDSRQRRYLLLSLRAVGLLAVLVLFFQPGVQLRNVTRVPNHIAVLVDTSESMSLPAQSRSEKPSRAARAASLLRREADTLEAWRRDHKVDFFTFGDRLLPSSQEALSQPGGVPSHADATRMREALAAVRQRYDSRDLAGVVLLSDGLDNGRLGEGQAEAGQKRKDPGKAGAAGPGGPGDRDGNDDDHGDPARANLDGDSLDFLRSLDAPVHTVAVGQPGLSDVSIARVLADEFAFARTPIRIEARLLVLGADSAGWGGRILPVTLRRDGAPVLTVQVALQDGQREYQVVFPFTPELVGKFLYEIATPVLPGEAIAENNRRAFVLKVIRDKIRVVHVAGRPSWDVRFLRGLLKHDPNIDLVSFFILRSPSDVDLGPSSETSLIPFPCEELFQQQLRTFDLIILQNFNYNAYCAEYLQPAIVPFVQEGGALAMIGGDLSFSSGGYYGSDLAQVLPVELIPEISPGLSLGQLSLNGSPGSSGSAGGPGRDRLISVEPFRPHLTPEGRSHVLTALRLDVRDNESRWESLPLLEGTNLIARPRPGATPLLVHPFLKDADGKPMPVVTVADFGKGRSMALSADSTWRWGFGALQAQKTAPPSATTTTTPPTTTTTGTEEHGQADARGTAYQRFWEQSIRWLIRDPSLRLLRVETAENEYGRDQPVRIELRALGPDYRPAPHTEISVSISRILGHKEAGETGPSAPDLVLAKTVRTDEDGEVHLELEPQKPGGYRVTARANLGGRGQEDIEVFLVRGAGRELQSPEADDRLLRALSQATLGQARTVPDGLSGLSFHEPHVVRVNKHRDVELWDHFLILALATVCFGLNWALRRRWGYA